MGNTDPHGIPNDIAMCGKHAPLENKIMHITACDSAIYIIAIYTNGHFVSSN